MSIDSTFFHGFCIGCIFNCIGIVIFRAYLRNREYKNNLIDLKKCHLEGMDKINKKWEDHNKKFNETYGDFKNAD